MTTVEFITALFYEVDEQLHAIPKHPEAHLWPSEVVTLGLLHALKGGGNRAFYHWLTRDYRPLFPQLPERSCTSILRVIPSPANQVQYPHFTTCVRGLCRGITPLFLPADVPGTPLVLRHAALCLAKRVYRRGAEAIPASAATAPALPRPEAVSWSHPQAPLCRL